MLGVIGCSDTTTTTGKEKKQKGIHFMHKNRLPQLSPANDLC